MMPYSNFPINQSIDYSPVKVEPSQLALDVITLMSKLKASCVLIVNQQQLLGIFTERDVVRLVAAGTLLEGVAIRSVMTTNVITVKESDVINIVSVLSLFRQYRIRHLPIVNQLEQLIGIITYESLRDILQPADLLKLRVVADVMTTNIIHAPLNATVLDLTQLMCSKRISCVVIVDASSENIFRPVGIVTERDIVKLQALRIDFTKTHAQNVMSAPLFPINSQDSLWLANNKMWQYNIRRLVVINEEETLLGIVTQSSILQSLDPVEMCTALDALQHIVEQRTIELRQANEQLKNQITRERLMVGIAQRIRQSLHLETILSTTVAEIRQFLQADRVIIYRFESDWSGIIIVESVNTKYKPLLGTVIQDNCFATNYVEAYKNGRVQQTTDIYNQTLSQCHVDILAALQIRANLVVPIVSGDSLWGLIAVNQCLEPRQWLEIEIELLQQLATQLAIAIQQAQLYKQLQAANQELLRLATSDGLTQIANRRYFDQYLNREWLRLSREQNPLSLILCDIDFFKVYNDTYGHLAGDDCLQQVASAIKCSVKRISDLAARYGGEEFAIILPNINNTGAMQVAQEIQSSINNLKIAHQESLVSKYVTLSIGVACTIPNNDISPQFLINAADQALYKAKSQGRDRIVIGCFEDNSVVAPFH